MAIKLFFIIGVPWAFEIAAWIPIFLSDGSSLGNHYIYLFEISNLLNSLRGVIIFIIFIVLQRDVRRYLLKRIFNKNELPTEAKDSHQQNSNAQINSTSTSPTSPVSGTTGTTGTSNEVETSINEITYL